MVNTGRAALFVLLRKAPTDRTAKAVMGAHARLCLPEPTLEEIAGYRRTPRGVPIEALAVQRYIESILDVRTKPLPRGQLKTGLRDFQREIQWKLEGSVTPKDAKHKKEFEGIALSISRLIALYYHEDGKKPRKLEGTRLVAVLPFLAQHLLAETELCIEARFTGPSKNLSKVSIFDIDDKLRMLQKHSDEIVRDNARTMVYAALRCGNLELADTLAEGATEKLEMLQGHGEEIVRDNARTMLSRTLSGWARP